MCKNRLSQPNFVAILGGSTGTHVRSRVGKCEKKTLPAEFRCNFGEEVLATRTKSSNVTHANLGLSLAVCRLAGPRMVAKGI